jgi:4-hydroxy-tetrahydrodipicolinate reductase
MGRALVRAASETPDQLTISGAVASTTSAALGQDAGELAGVGRLDLRVTDDLAAALARADVVIDFSQPHATRSNLAVCRAARKPLLIGTTGFAPDLTFDFDAAATEIPLLVAPNTSIGVTLLIELTRIAAKALPAEFDIEIIEAHHRMKKDAPSGTALALGNAAAEGRALVDALQSASGQRVVDAVAQGQPIGVGAVHASAQGQPIGGGAAHGSAQGQPIGGGAVHGSAQGQPIGGGAVHGSAQGQPIGGGAAHGSAQGQLISGDAAHGGSSTANPPRAPGAGGAPGFDRSGQRTPGDIGYAVIRGGDIVGDHTVLFAGTGEQVSLSHRATDRAVFARGALRAALWLAGRPPGRYFMRDFIGLKTVT